VAGRLTLTSPHSLEIPIYTFVHARVILLRIVEHQIEKLNITTVRFWVITIACIKLCSGSVMQTRLA